MKVAVFKPKADAHEHEVEEEHGEAKAPVHLPPEARDADDDKDQHGEKQHDATDHAFGVHFDWLAVYQPVEEPREGEPGN